MGRPKKSIAEKVQNDYPDFAQEVEGLSVSDLEKRLSNFAKAIAENDENQENDEKLEEAKDVVSELAAAYSGPRKELKLKSRYMTSLIKEKGGQ